MASDDQDNTASLVHSPLHARMQPERTVQDAVAWHLRLSSPTACESDFEEFAVWIESDPNNRSVFDQVEDLDTDLSAALLEETKPKNSDSWRPVGAQPRGLGRFGAHNWMAGAAMMAASLLIVIPVATRAPQAMRYATAIGQSRTVHLPDGSMIDMSTDTSITVQIGATKRYVILDRGEAVFRIRPDRERPFLVRAGDREVRDIGTVFDVLCNSGEVTIAVAEGQIAVGRVSDAESVILRAGDRVRHTEGTNSSERDRIDPKLVTAWQSGYLVYQDAPLTRVIGDLNRYFRIPIIVEPGAPFSLRFSGVLHIRDQAAAIAQLTAFLPIVAVHVSDGSIRLRAAAMKP